MLRNLTLAFVFTTAACSSSDDKFMEKTVGIMEGLAKAVESSDGDCTKMASNIEGFIKKNEADIKELKATSEAIKKDEGRAKKMAESAEKYKDRLEKAMPAMMGMMKCSDEPKMKELEEKLQGLM